MSSAIAHRLQGLLAAIDRELDRSGVPGELFVTVYVRNSDVVRIGASELDGARVTKATGNVCTTLNDRVRLVVPGSHPVSQTGLTVQRGLRLVGADEKPDPDGSPF